MRTRFDQELGKLNVELITMGALCEEAIGLVAGALTKGRTVQAADINALEVRIDHKERDIESLCMMLLLQQQPVAGDLRVISSALKMISDMERIGDQAADIAETLQYITDTEAESKSHIAEMAAAAGRMVEVNTSGLHYACKEMFPAPALLAAFRRAGVPCTVGTDAHKPAHVARGIEQAYRLMAQAGYRTVTVPTADGDRREVTIE